MSKPQKPPLKPAGPFVPPAAETVAQGLEPGRPGRRGRPNWPAGKIALSGADAERAHADAAHERMGATTRLPLSVVAAGLLLAAMSLAGAVAWGLHVWLSQAIGAQSGPFWTAPLAAMAAVVVAAVPLLLLTLRLRSVPSLSVPDGEPLPAGPQGIPRALFMDLAAREWARARRYGTGTAMLLVQLDRFARLVEARGPAAADVALSELISQTAPTLRAADLVTRFSECEIAVFLAHSDAMGALDVAERIRERAEQLEVVAAQFPGQKLRITVSVGVAQLRPAHLNLLALADDAEDAVDAARQAGGNCVRAAPVPNSRIRPAGSGSWRDGYKAQP